MTSPSRFQRDRERVAARTPSGRRRSRGSGPAPPRSRGRTRDGSGPGLGGVVIRAAPASPGRSSPRSERRSPVLPLEERCIAQHGRPRPSAAPTGAASRRGDRGRARDGADGLEDRRPRPSRATRHEAHRLRPQRAAVELDEGEVVALGQDVDPLGGDGRAARRCNRPRRGAPGVRAGPSGGQSSAGPVHDSAAAGGRSRILPWGIIAQPWARTPVRDVAATHGRSTTATTASVTATARTRRSSCAA